MHIKSNSWEEYIRIYSKHSKTLVAHCPNSKTMLKTLFNLWVNECPTRKFSYWTENTWWRHGGGYHLPWISRWINTGYRLLLKCRSFPLHNGCCNTGADTSHKDKFLGKNGAKITMSENFISSSKISSFLQFLTVGKYLLLSWLKEQNLSLNQLLFLLKKNLIKFHLWTFTNIP